MTIQTTDQAPATIKTIDPQQLDTYVAYVMARQNWLNLLTLANKSGDNRLQESQELAWQVVDSLRTILAL